MSPCCLSDTESKFSCALCLITYNEMYQLKVLKKAINEGVDEERGNFVDGKLGGVRWAHGEESVAGIKDQAVLNCLNRV